jgi:DNA polymerase-3 subunit delta'
MQIEDYLNKHQKVVYKTFLNSLNKKSLSHAYLLVGNPGTPLFEVAHFLAKSLLCDDPSPFACNTCITCLRIDDNNYPDFLIFDGSKSTIVKDNIAQIESRFEKKAFESKGIRIYILHLVENMTDEAVNALLKFLEEPDENVFAFLTTNNESNVLPTIISRCQTLKLISVPRIQIIEDAIRLGVTLEDAEFLSFFIGF